MAKKRYGRFSVLNFVAWLTGIIVSLAVGFAMIGGTLTLPAWLGGDVIAAIAGWIVIITTALGVILSIVDCCS
jgi:hypothetical protein